LDYPLNRAASSKNSVVLAAALQSRPTTLFFGARPSRSAPESPRAVPTPAASFRPIEPSCGALRPERTSARVQPLGPCCMMSLSFCGRHSPGARSKTTHLPAFLAIVLLSASPSLRCHYRGQAPSRLRKAARGSGGRLRTSRLKKALKYSIRSRIETTAVGWP
jgi:hypothetical protein